MPLAKNLQDLPQSRAAEGWPPDDNPLFVRVLAERIVEQELEEYGPDHRPTAHDTRLRHSDAGKCSRALALGVAGAPKEPIDAAGRWVMGLGTLIHDAWQDAMLKRYGPDAVVVEPKCRVEGVDASGHADAVITYSMIVHENAMFGTPGRKILYELKTTGGFSYKKKVGESGPAEGPDLGHVMQAAINARALDCDEVRIGYIATEAISKQRAARYGIGEWERFCAEWTIPLDLANSYADAELRRWGRILELFDGGKLAPRMIPHVMPAGAEIVDVDKGRWELRQATPGDVDEAPVPMVTATGTVWQCAYCPFQAPCKAIGPGIVSLEHGPVPKVLAGDTP